MAEQKTKEEIQKKIDELTIKMNSSAPSLMAQEGYRTQISELQKQLETAP